MWGMQTINIFLPDELKEFVDNQVECGRNSSVSEYVRDLIRIDEQRKAQEKLVALLMEGIQSSERSYKKSSFCLFPSDRLYRRDGAPTDL